MATYLRGLSDVIAVQVERIETLLKEKGLTLPSPNEPFDPSSEGARQDPEILKAITTLAAAADQLATTARPPHQPLLECAAAFYFSSALGVALFSNTAEILRDAGPQGLHVDEIASRSNVHPQKLARILRVLTTRFIFNEIARDVFANNKLSSLLDSGRSVEEIQKNPKNKYDGPPTVVSLLESCLDEMYKAAAYMPENLTNPLTARSEEPTETAMNDCFKHNLTLFEWYEQPENKDRLERFTSSMVATQHFYPPSLILQCFDWKRLSGEILVDVGGGNGSTSAVLVQNIPDIKIIVQDRALVIKDAENYWAEKNPEAILTGAVVLEAHDFFDDQPQREVGAFLLRFILHNWSDKYVIKILRSLHTAVNKVKPTKLIVVDTVTPSASDYGYNKLGSSKPDAEESASDAVVSNSRAHLEDMHMLLAFNAQVRTLAEFGRVFRSGGWKLEEVHAHPTDSFSVLIASPLDDRD